MRILCYNFNPNNDITIYINGTQNKYQMVIVGDHLEYNLNYNGPFEFKLNDMILRKFDNTKDIYEFITCQYGEHGVHPRYKPVRNPVFIPDNELPINQQVNQPINNQVNQVNEVSQVDFTINFIAA